MDKKTKILFITESTFDFSTIEPSSVLLTTPINDLVPGVYHTSLGDMTVDEIIKVSKLFDEIKIEPRGFDESSLVYQESLSVYRYLDQNKQTNNDLVTFTDHSDIATRSNEPILWVFGCSHSHGVGLKSNEDPYGKHLAQFLNLPLKLITKPGSSLAWSYRHLFNSVIEPRDVVVWQLTTPGRLSRFNGKHVEEIVLNSTNDRKLLDSVTDQQLYFVQISMLNTGIKYLRKLGCKFVFTSLTDFGSSYDHVAEYVKYPEYCSHYGLHLDYGADGVHAGPLSHKAIAQRLLNHIQLLDVQSIPQSSNLH